MNLLFSGFMDIYAECVHFYYGTYLLLYICTLLCDIQKWWIIIYRRKFYLIIIKYSYLIVNNINLVRLVADLRIILSSYVVERIEAL